MVKSRISLRINKTTVLYPWLIMMYLFFCSDSLLFLYNSNTSFQNLYQYSLPVVAVGCIGYTIVKCKYKLSRAFVGLLVSVVWIFLAGAYHGEFSGGYITKISLFLIGFSIMSLMDKRIFMDTYIKIVIITSVFSLVGFLLRPLIASLPLPIITNASGYQFKWFFFSNIPLTKGTGRNFGPFTEPSRYQAYLNFAIMYILFCPSKAKINYKVLALFTITLVTTFSSTGFVTLGVILIAFILSPKVNISSLKKSMLIILALGVIATLMTFNDDFSYAITKLSFGEKSESYSVRYNSLFGGLITLADNFIFGTGINNANEAFMNASSSLYSVLESTTNTNTMLINFTKFGFIPGWFYLRNWYKTLMVISRNNLITLVLLCSVFLMLSGISFFESLFFNIIVFFYIDNRNGSYYENSYDKFE